MASKSEKKSGTACPKCGSKLRANALSCKKCGCRIETDGTMAEDDGVLDMPKSKVKIVDLKKRDMRATDSSGVLGGIGGIIGDLLGDLFDFGDRRTDYEDDIFEDSEPRNVVEVDVEDIEL